MQTLVTTRLIHASNRSGSRSPEVAPGDHQRVLEGILGSVDVAEDPIGEREEAVARGPDQVDECRLVATLRRLDEIPVAVHRRCLS